MKKYLAFALALVMALALIPGMALADRQDGGKDNKPQGNYLNQSRWNGDIKVVYDTFEQSTYGKTSKNGQGVKEIKLNNIAVSQQNSGQKGSAKGETLKNYYTDASNKNEQSVKLAVTADEGYYVSRIVVACIDPEGRNPYSCQTWNAGNAYDVRFSLADSKKETDGTFTLETNLSSKQFCHTSNGSNHGYYILIQVAPIPQPVYVEYDYGNVLELSGNDADITALFSDSKEWTVAGSGNAYGIGEGNFVEYTKFAYNYSQPSDIQNWKHTTNSISQNAINKVNTKRIVFKGWQVTYYADCYNNGNELTFSNQVGTSAVIDAGKELNVYTHAKLVAQWEVTQTPPQPEKAKLTIRKEVKGLEGSDVPSDDYAVTVRVGETDYVLNKANSYTQIIELNAGTYTVEETTKSNINGYNIEKTEYSNLDANNGVTLAEGGEATVTVTNTYVKQRVPKANLTISKTVEGVEIPEGYEVTVAVNGTEYKLNKDNQFSLNIEVAPGKYTIEEKGCTEINGYYCESTTITINGQTTQEIELADLMEGKVEITNKYAEAQKPQNSQLTISKNFRGVYTSDLPREFTVYVRPVNAQDNTLGSAIAVTLKRDNNYTATIEVESGIYEVTEQSPYLSGYVFTGANYSAESTGENPSGLPNTKGTYVSLGENEPASVAITNSYYYDYTPVTPPPAKPLPPQTGDSGTAYMGIALCVMAAAAFVAARSRKHS